jgi:hypothetical protein
MVFGLKGVEMKWKAGIDSREISGLQDTYRGLY